MVHMTHRSGHKAKTDYKPSDREIELAEKRIQFYVDDWPEDDWFSLTPGAELNLYTLDTLRGPVKRAAIYPIRDGDIITLVWYRLFIRQATGN